ncbi:RND family efflux transporter MFP subunit [Dyadobacter jejuensis]|uniref:RND family efflux transporter MFP subunit n=1 Tax=Dyadobacter jejuensis TaxID=1082580 RepID=A0A316AN84_9BACT|nr:HlyD family efflux transporter periplasmic adaptor subunit [Dyadobacter jejuensis]PWJ58918.1 RND family efflux transporter MFP subunit [Dyadobacter jejuensis]
MKLYITLIILIGLFACQSKTEHLKPTVGPITESVYASGIVKSRNQYQAYAASPGIISKLLVRKGQVVSKGTPIIQITNVTAKLNTDNAALTAQYASEAANKEKLEELTIAIDLAQTKRDNDWSMLERQKALWAKNIGTRNELDARTLTYQNSENALETAKLRLADLKKQIAFQRKQSLKLLEISKSMAQDYTVRSEIDGTVYDIFKEAGEMVNATTPVAIVGASDDFVLELQIDENDIASLKIGQNLFLSMDSYKGQLFEAVVSSIIPVMNERSKSFTVEADFIKAPPTLYPYLTCEANIVISKKDKVLTIPRNYLMPGDSVMLENNIKRKVVTGLKDYQRVEIISGITENDLITIPQE